MVLQMRTEFTHSLATLIDRTINLEMKLHKYPISDCRPIAFILLIGMLLLLSSCIAGSRYRIISDGTNRVLVPPHGTLPKKQRGSIVFKWILPSQQFTSCNTVVDGVHATRQQGRLIARIDLTRLDGRQSGWLFSVAGALVESGCLSDAFASKTYSGLIQGTKMVQANP